MRPKNISEDTIIQVKLKHIIWIIGIVGSLILTCVGFAWNGINTKVDKFIDEDFKPVKEQMNKTNIDVGIILDRTSGHNKTTEPSTPGEKSAPGK